MNIVKEFKEFAVKGNVVDMGVGIVVGAAFTSIVNSFVKDVITPFISLFTTEVNFTNWFVVLKQGDKANTYATLGEAQADNAVTLNIGLFVNSVISFLIVAAVLFFVIRAINRLKRPAETIVEPTQSKECPYCYSVIPLKATRCPCCTSDVGSG